MIASLINRNIGTYSYKINYIYEVNSPMEFNKAIIEIYDRLSQCKSLPLNLWFRGQTDKAYVLLPSLIRNYPADTDISMPELLRKEIEQFLIQSRGAVERVSSSVLYKNAFIECIAEMQHYSYDTNLLDWSENPFVSMYFACENVMNSHVQESDATIYVLHPRLYNMIRSKIIQFFPQANAYRQQAPQLRNEGTARVKGNLIPYFGAPYYIESENYVDFVYGPDVCDPFPSKNKWDENPLQAFKAGKGLMAPLLPLAVQVPRTTVRIIKQAGTFIAFNLCDQPTIPTTGNERFRGFEHTELEEIQKFYLECDEFPCVDVGQGNSVKIPFLYRINLAAQKLPIFAQFLRAIGQTKDKVYPELYTIIEQIRNKSQL